MNMPAYWRDRTAAAAIIALTVMASFHVRQLPSDAALFPTLTLALSGALAVLLLISTFLGERKPDADEPFLQNPRNFAIVLGLTPLYLYFVSTIGYFSASSIYMLLLAFLLGFQHLSVLVLGTAGFMAFVYIVFVVVFARPLPPEFFLSAQ